MHPGRSPQNPFLDPGDSQPSASNEASSSNEASRSIEAPDAKEASTVDDVLEYGARKAISFGVIRPGRSLVRGEKKPEPKPKKRPIPEDLIPNAIKKKKKKKDGADKTAASAKAPGTKHVTDTLLIDRDETPANEEGTQIECSLRSCAHNIQGVCGKEKISMMSRGRRAVCADFQPMGPIESDLPSTPPDETNDNDSDDERTA